MSQILVFGATGNVGSQVCRALAKRSVPFRAALHNISKGDEVKKLGNNIEIAQVDHGKSETVEAALQGVGKVFLMFPPFSPLEPEFATIDTIKKVGTVKHIVMLAALGTEDGGKFTWAKEYHALEEAIRKTGIPLTSIRPSTFAANLLRDAKNVKENSFISAGIEQRRMNWISPKDIGEISAVALLEGEKHYGKHYDVTGPDTVTSDEVAKIVGSVLGKEITYKPVSLAQRKQRFAAILPPNQVEAYCDMYMYFANGGYDRHSPDLEKVTGSKGQTLAEWVQDNRAAFE